jgi:hypothetical protein
MCASNQHGMEKATLQPFLRQWGHFTRTDRDFQFTEQKIRLHKGMLKNEMSCKLRDYIDRQPEMREVDLACSFLAL